MDTISVFCPHCGKRNQIVAVGVNANEVVTCSHCQSELGRLDQLQMQSDRSKSDREAYPEAD